MKPWHKQHRQCSAQASPLHCLICAIRHSLWSCAGHQGKAVSKPSSFPHLCNKAFPLVMCRPSGQSSKQALFSPSFIRHVCGDVQAVKACGGTTLCGVNYCAMDKYSAPATAKGLKNCTDSLKVPSTQLPSLPLDIIRQPQVCFNSAALPLCDTTRQPPQAPFNSAALHLDTTRQRVCPSVDIGALRLEPGWQLDRFPPGYHKTARVGCTIHIGALRIKPG